MIRQGWGWILAQGYKTTPEYFKTNPYTEVYAMRGLPVRPIIYQSISWSKLSQGSGFNYVDIYVMTSGVTDAEGTYPHPKGGVIAVKWHTELGKKVFDYVKAPEGVNVNIKIV